MGDCTKRGLQGAQTRLVRTPILAYLYWDKDFYVRSIPMNRESHRITWRFQLSSQTQPYKLLVFLCDIGIVICKCKHIIHPIQYHCIIHYAMLHYYTDSIIFDQFLLSIITFRITSHISFHRYCIDITLHLHTFAEGIQ